MFKCEGREVYPERPEEVSGSPSRATIGKETFAKREGFFVSKGEGQKKARMIHTGLSNIVNGILIHHLHALGVYHHSIAIQRVEV